MQNLAASLLLATAALGCVESPVSEVTQESGCGTYLCGSNSPHAGVLSFYELAVDGTPAENNHFKIVGFRDKLNMPMKLDVQGFHLIGRRPNGTSWAGPILQGSKITIANESMTFEITLDSVVVNQRYYEDGDDGTLLPSYGMTIQRIDAGGGNRAPVHMCPQPHAMSWMFQAGAYDALFYRGDRYDSATGRIYATGDAAGPWFNIACAGDDLSKILVARHAEVAKLAPTFVTTATQRTAMIQMLRADYCGTATPLTTLGVALDWANVGGWNTLDGDLTDDNIEAIWTGTGPAVCLTNKRNPGVVLPCPEPPPCTDDQITNWQHYGELVSRIP